MTRGKLGGLQITLSRRGLLKGAAALTAAASVPEAAFGQQATGAPFGTVWLYIGTYTGAPGAFGSNGMGIYLCELNLSTGALTVLRLVGPVVTTGIATNSPSTLALDPTRTHLYAGRAARSRDCLFDRPADRQSDALEFPSY